MKIEFEKLDLEKIIKEVYHWLINFNDWSSPLGKLVSVALGIGILFGLLLAGDKFLVLINKIIESVKTLNNSISLGDERIKIILRQQFCRVLRADLEKIASGENWNDQWFTDLEAEVEAEGNFFATPLHRLFNRVRTGNRKEPSLMAAIEKSTERCMLLVGDPGSGKSIAVRHLAQGLSEIGVKSKARRIRVPLYINLREFLVQDPHSVNADTVRDFILDHVRRGDASTAQYIRANWEDFLQKGVWYFLFDSFDEIPAVLHAEKGSKIIEKFSEAIRQFMDGMGECRGILASREFKGPEALPWKKLRILPLDNKRQLNLIRNAALTNELASLVCSQLAAAHSAIYKNPLFLSLLCRYVKEHHRCPQHNYALLIDHLEQLSQRDADWVEKQYNFKPLELLAGAEQIASILAQNDSLGLAPTFGEITQILNKLGKNEEDTLNLLNALIYVKIGRNDVKEARQGDRRFAFAHRRYQESLFVTYLVRNPSLLPVEELLLNSKWREYTVALLQSQNIEACAPLLKTATELINEWCKVRKKRIESLFNAEHSYFEWEVEQEVHLLALLQEGLAQRLDEISPALSASIERLISARWSSGDCYDQLRSIELGGLVPTKKLEQRITEALSLRIDELTRASFSKVAFLKSVPEELANWVRRRVADEAIVARDVIELSRLDLLVARLPPELGAQRVLNRNRRLRWLLYRPLLRFMFDGIVKFSRYTNANFGFIVKNNSETRVDLVVMYGAFLSLFTTLISLASFLVATTLLGKSISIIAVCCALNLCCMILWRDNKDLISPLTVIWSGVGGIRAFFSIGFLPLALFLFLPISIAIAAIWYFKSAVVLAMLGILCVASVVLGMSWKMIETRKSLSYLDSIIGNSQNDAPALHARTSSELLVWLTHHPEKLLTSTTIARSLLKALDHLPLSPHRSQKHYPIFDLRSLDKFPRHKNLILQHLLLTENALH